MEYEQIAELERYVQQAKAAAAERNRRRAEDDAAFAARRAHEDAEKAALVKARLQEIVPPALWPLARLDNENDVRPGNWQLAFFYDDLEIMRFSFLIRSNMTVEPREIEVPTAALCAGHDEDDRPMWCANMLWRVTTIYIEQVDGSHYGVDQWEFATARAFEVLAAYRDYATRAAVHNAEPTPVSTLIAETYDFYAKRRQEDATAAPVSAEAEMPAPEPPAPEPYILLELDNRHALGRAVGQYLESGYALHGRPFVVLHDDPEYPNAHIPYYYQAVIWPEPL